MMSGVISVQINNEYHYVILSDPHNGAFKATIWYEELKLFLNRVEKMKKLDFIIITGDYFHTKISANSDDAKYALKFLTKLLKLCAKKGSKLRIIKGTESHDNRQLEMFDGLNGVANCDFKIFHTVGEEWLFDDLRVLYIPEEYMEDKDEYYKQYFENDNKYDFIFGHGLMDKAVFLAATQESEETRSQAPIFKVNDLHNISHGPIYFGHIHKPMVIDRFKYVGSYSRWAFGEEEDKGFIIGTYNTETKEFTDEFIVNEKARRFDTIKLEYTSTIFKKSEQEQVSYLIELVKSFQVDFLRLEINIPIDYPNPLLLTGLLNETFNKYAGVKLKIINNSKMRQKKEMEEKVDKLLKTYGFLFDNSRSPEEKISKYIEIRYGRVIPIDKMTKYLYEDPVSSKRGK